MKVNEQPAQRRRRRSRPAATQTYNVNVTNTGNAPEAFFVDPRLNQNETISLLDLNLGSAAT